MDAVPLAEVIALLKSKTDQEKQARHDRANRVMTKIEDEVVSAYYGFQEGKEPKLTEEQVEQGAAFLRRMGVREQAIDKCKNEVKKK